MLDSKFTEQVQNLITKSNQIVILTHYNPDGDAIGSSLALHFYLKKIGKDSQIIVPNEFPKFLKNLPQAKSIIIAEHQFTKSKITIENADLIFCLDFNSKSRINQLGEYLEKSKAKKVLIDHHQEPDIFDFMYSDTQEPATCQMIYNFIESSNHLNYIDQDIAECIYTGIYTDTGGFRFRSTSSKTHKIASFLLETGIKSDEIISKILDNNTEARLKLLSIVLQNVEIINELKTAILYVTREDLLKFGYQKGDTEGFVNYGLSISGIEISVFLIEDLKQDFVKISFRSKDNFDVNKFAKIYFEGGGHKQAAGGKSELSIQETINKIKKILENYEN